MLSTALALSLAFTAANPITVDVDARDIGKRIVHAKVVIPASPGPLSLSYPKWLPGNHAPTGPLNGVVNLRLTSGGVQLPWRRDAVEMFTLHVDVPAGASAVEASFDYVEDAAGSTTFTENTAVLLPNTVVLVPGGARTDDLRARARVTLPAGWGYGSGMLAVKRSGDVVEFEELSLTMLVDSPIAMGRYHRRIALGDKHSIFLVADSAGALEVPADTITQWKQLVAEAGVTPGMTLVAVNGRRDSPEVMDAALLAARKDKAPLELLVENAGFFRTVKADYHDGARYPVLARDPKRPDVLTKILAPRTPHAPRTPKAPKK